MFPCTSCGLCCTKLNQIKELNHLDSGNGVCIHFDLTNKVCLIYKNRPNLCRIDYMYDTYYHKHYSRPEYYQLNAKVCNQLQEKVDLPLAFRVVAGD